MTGIIDYGVGNLGSVRNAFRFLGLDIKIISRKEDLRTCRALVLPGVGAFGNCMEHLTAHDLEGIVRNWVLSGKPLMGICLGMQVLFCGSEESPGILGLGLFEGTVRKFSLSSHLKVPQIGWNRLIELRSGCPMFEGVKEGSFFYLVHSFHACPEDESITAGRMEYGVKYCSCVWKDNVFATQFHPEKSQSAGLRILRNFHRWAEKQ